ncbi:MAG: ATPase, T2SS/T4P/T4SS family, partial [Planctomycetota bacterium]
MKYSGQPNIAELVDSILDEAVQFGASDIHFEPTNAGLQVKYRMDGTLKTIETLPAAIRDNVISRLKVLGNLLTYRNDIPQEGRIEGTQG